MRRTHSHRLCVVEILQSSCWADIPHSVSQLIQGIRGVSIDQYLTTKLSEDDNKIHCLYKIFFSKFNRRLLIFFFLNQLPTLCSISFCLLKCTLLCEMNFVQTFIIIKLQLKWEQDSTTSVIILGAFPSFVWKAWINFLYACCCKKHHVKWVYHLLITKL